MKQSDITQREENEVATGTPLGVQVLSFLCGLVVAVLGFKSVHQDYAFIQKMTHLDRFVETSGKFLQVKVRRDTTGSSEDFYPDVLYEYIADGKSIWGWRLSYEERPHSKNYWEERLKGYATEAPVQVFYNPDSTKDSILEKKLESLFRTWMKMLLGVGFLLAGLVLSILPISTWVRKAFAKA